MSLARWGVLASVLAAAAAGACSDDSPAPPDTTLGCAKRVEGAPGLPAIDARRDLVTPALVMGALRDEARRARKDPERVARNYREGFGVVKVLTGARASRDVTVSIDASGPRLAGLAYGIGPGDPRTPRYRVRDSHRSVEFQGCARDEPRRDGRGPVGAHTWFAGGVVVARAHCMRVRVQASGEDAREYRLAWGVPPGRCAS